MSKSPSLTPAEVLALRLAADLTQGQAAARVFSSSYRTWQDWERGVRQMPVAISELWKLQDRIKMIIDFLKTTSSKDKLKNALEVLREFKECESDSEYLMIDFSAWAKLEQLEEFLEHLVEDAPLAADTVDYLGSTG